MNNYQELKIWQKPMDLVEKVYVLIPVFPKEEIYGLMVQTSIGYVNAHGLNDIF